MCGAAKNSFPVMYSPLVAALAMLSYLMKLQSLPPASCSCQWTHNAIVKHFFTVVMDQYKVGQEKTSQTVPTRHRQCTYTDLKRLPCTPSKPSPGCLLSQTSPQRIQRLQTSLCADNIKFVISKNIQLDISPTTCNFLSSLQNLPLCVYRWCKLSRRKSLHLSQAL